MSEFTAGSLTIQPYKAILNDMNLSYMKDLNDKWVLFMTEGTEVNDEVPEQVRDISAGIPGLYFYNFEDHGWGYWIVYQGEELARVQVSYELMDGFIMDLAAERYPDEDVFELIYLDPHGRGVYRQLEQEIRALPSYEEAIANQFANCNVEQFCLFDVDNDSVERLRLLLNAEYYKTLGSYRQLVGAFKELLQIKEMSWIRYDNLGDSN